MGSIYTDEAQAAYEIFKKVSDPLAQKLFYQCLFHIDVFNVASEQLKKAMEELNFHNFARTQTCHMTEGIFGEAKHTAYIETAKQKVIGYLGVTISSGHKCLRAMQNARKSDRGIEWKQSKRELDSLVNKYRIARDACEHLDESINKGDTKTLEDFSFSPYNILRFTRIKKERRESHEFDFSPETLQKISDLWKSTLDTIKARKV